MNDNLFETFVKAVDGSGTELRLKELNSEYSPLTNDALFHLPLISIAILIISKGKRLFTVAESGRLVGLLLENSISGFKGSTQGLGWSSTLRARTAEAVAVLESLGHVCVHGNPDRIIELTERGNKFVLQIRKGENSLGEAVRGMFRNLSEAQREMSNLL